MHTIEVYQGNHNLFHWRVKDGNGEILFWSKGFRTPEAARRAALKLERSGNLPEQETAMQVSRAAAKLGHSHCDEIPTEQRSQLVPHNGGRRRKYPRCPRYKSGRHNFYPKGVCVCGFSPSLAGATSEAAEAEVSKH